MNAKNESICEIDQGSFSSAAVAAFDTPTQLKRDSRADSQPTTRNPLIARFLHLLFPEQRKADRLTVLNLVAFLGSVCTSQAYDIGDVSTSGCYMITRERWIPGTVMPVTLLRTKKSGQSVETTITLQSTVVRSGPDGVGFAFLLDGNKEQQLGEFLDGLQLSQSDEPDLMRAS